MGFMHHRAEGPREVKATTVSLNACKAPRLGVMLWMPVTLSCCACMRLLCALCTTGQRGSSSPSSGQHQYLRPSLLDLQT